MLRKVSVINMRSITVLVFACACALASGFYMTKDVKYADKEFLKKQTDILNIFQHIHQDVTKLNEEIKDFKWAGYKEHCTKPEVVDVFLRFYDHGMLGLNEVFSIMDELHREEAIALFHVLYCADDWETFYEILSWARLHINKGMFIYASTVAIFHRKDTVGIVVPAIYEIYPYYFFDNYVVQQAKRYKMQGFPNIKKIEDVYTVIIPSNNTGHYVHTNPEQTLSYFTEDMGLNAHYYYFHIDYPFWMEGTEFNLNKDRRGEYYLYKHQQFLARYYLERLANGLGKIPEFSLDKPIKTGYYSTLAYYNGEFFSSRPNYYTINTEDNFYFVDQVEDYDRHIRDIIDYGYIILPGGTYLDITKPENVEVLGNIFQGNPDSKFVRLHGYLELVMRLLGASIDHIDQHKIIPSVLEHFETAMRDPVFYQFYKKLIKHFFYWQKYLPHYTREEVDFPGVKIVSVEVEKLVTFIDNFDSEITNVVDVEVNKPVTPIQQLGRFSQYLDSDFVIKTRQPRLNHLPFTFNLTISSETKQVVTVKAFIGPKRDENGHIFTFEENRENFFELDHFLVELEAGKNDIVRKSEDFSWFVRDRITYYELYKQVMLATKDEIKFPLDMTEAHCGFPMRFMMPMGQRGGMPYTFFFMVIPYVKPKIDQFTGYDHTVSCGIGSGARYIDDLPFGYPFNRPIDEKYWLTPNMYYYDVNIFHKTEKDINSAH